MASSSLRDRVVVVVGDITRQDIAIMNAASVFLDCREFE
jgi:hypothetical protein